jgi:hypothetical protein
MDRPSLRKKNSVNSARTDAGDTSPSVVAVVSPAGCERVLVATSASWARDRSSICRWYREVSIGEVADYWSRPC